MLYCRNPYVAGGGAVHGCGQCMPCRINHKRMWTHRIMLETTQHPVNSFWTLTYADAHLPLTPSGLPTLQPKHLTDFMKRLRVDLARRNQPNIRYYYVGEYGEQTERPHYHLALFNHPTCERGLTRHDKAGNCCSICDHVRRIWNFGNVYAGNLEDASASYIAGYITKKWSKTQEGGPEGCLKGRTPEYARMSKRPGIGAGFIPEVASVVLTHNTTSIQNDVPTSLAHNRTVRPLGRYLTRLLREQVGMAPNAPEATLQKQREKVQPLREAAKAICSPGTYKETLKSLVIEAGDGRAAQMENRAKIFKQKRHL